LRTGVGLFAVRDHFARLTTDLMARVEGAEVLLCAFRGEVSDFVRLNGGRVRQAGNVCDWRISLELIEDGRHAGAHCNLSGERDDDLALLSDALARLRVERAGLETDPYLLYATEPHDSDDVRTGELPDPADVTRHVAARAAGLDVTGIWASGTLAVGFANSLGQRNWYESESFNFDWSCHSPAGNAVKCSYAGATWDDAELDAKLEAARAQLRILDRPARRLVPGRYRAYLAPAAVGELLALLSWDAFSLKSHRTRQTPLVKMITEGRRLGEAVDLCESPVTGLAPRFTSSGFMKADRVDLIKQGAYTDCLVDPRSAREYDVAVNAAHGYPESLEMSAGALARDAATGALGEGLHVGNLWYTNFSDRNDCRITGMTRFACFWVEGGEIVAPIDAMRFDDSLYGLLGDRLLALTRERELIVDPGTYDGRSMTSAKLPGVLVDELLLTL
jgi:predicted Zn-dependent protease